MKFRDYEIDEVKILKANSSEDLEHSIKNLDIQYVIIDLQYSMGRDGTSILWTALALLKRKSSKKKNLAEGINKFGCYKITQTKMSEIKKGEKFITVMDGKVKPDNILVLPAKVEK